MRQALRTFRRYIFELIVIFIGITTSFLFEEWRGNRNETNELKVLYNKLNKEIESVYTAAEGIYFKERLYSRVLNGDTSALTTAILLSRINHQFYFKKNRLPSLNQLLLSDRIKLIDDDSVVMMCARVRLYFEILDKVDNSNEETIRTRLIPYLERKKVLNTFLTLEKNYFFLNTDTVYNNYKIPRTLIDPLRPVVMDPELNKIIIELSRYNNKELIIGTETRKALKLIQRHLEWTLN